MGLDNIISSSKEKLKLLYKEYVEDEWYEDIAEISDKIKRSSYFEIPNFNKRMIKRINEFLDEGITHHSDVSFVATAAVVYELYKRDPTYFDFVKPGNVADVAVETFDYLLNQGKAREVYRRLEEFLEKPLSQIPEFQKLVEFIDKYGFTPYKEAPSKYGEAWKEMVNGVGDIIGQGIAYYADLDRYVGKKYEEKLEGDLLPAFAKVIAKKTEEYLKKLGY